MGKPSVAHTDPLDEWSDRTPRVPFECSAAEGVDFMAGLEDMCSIMSEHTHLTRDELRIAVLRTLGWMAKNS